MADGWQDYQPQQSGTATAPQPGFMARLNKRVAANFEPLHRPEKFLTDTGEDVVRRLRQPYVPGSGLKEIYQSLKQTVSDPANIAGDVVSGYMTGQLGGGGEEAPDSVSARAPRPTAEPSPTLGRVMRAGRAIARLNPKVRLVEQVAKALSGPEPPAPPTPAPPARWTGPTGPPSEWGRPPIDPALTSPSRTLPGQVSPEVTGRPAAPGAAPIPPRSGLMLPGEVEQPTLREQVRASQAERRTAQRPFEGPNRRVAAEMRGFETAPPLPPERLGFDTRPVLDKPGGDIGSKVRGGTEAKMGPIKRGGAKALQQAEALRMRPRLIEQMGGVPPETITEPRGRSTWVGGRPVEGDVDLIESLKESVRRAKSSGDELLPGDPGYQWKMRRR